MPVLAGAAAVFECRLVEVATASTHSIFIGEVEAAAWVEAAPGLVYHDREYRRLQRIDGHKKAGLDRSRPAIRCKNWSLMFSAARWLRRGPPRSGCQPGSQAR